MKTQLGIEITGIATAVSNNWTPISSFHEMDEKTVAKFIKNTGVKGRYNASEKQTTSDFCFAAAENLLRTKKIDRNRINALILVTQSPDYKSPASACVLHGRLGLSENCLAFDINLGCSGFTSSLATIGSILANQAEKGGGFSSVVMRRYFCKSKNWLQ